MTVATSQFLTIVSGLPRSGTSMMMQVLEAGGLPVLTDGIRSADEDNPRGYYEFEAVKRTKDDPSWLLDAPGKVVKIIYRLLYDLPPGYEYRVVFMQRDLAEVLRSQTAMLERNGRPPGALGDDQMRRVFERELRDFRSWISQQPHFTLLPVSYNDLLREPRPHLTTIDEFLGGGLHVDRMLTAIDRSLYRNRT